MAGPDYFYNTYMMFFKMFLLQVHWQQALIRPLSFLFSKDDVHTGRKSILLLSQILLLALDLIYLSLREKHTHTPKEVVYCQVPVFRRQVRLPLRSSLVGNDCRNCTVIFLYFSKCSLIGKKIYKYKNIYEYI